MAPKYSGMRLRGSWLSTPSKSEEADGETLHHFAAKFVGKCSAQSVL